MQLFQAMTVLLLSLPEKELICQAADKPMLSLTALNPHSSCVILVDLHISTDRPGSAYCHQTYSALVLLVEFSSVDNKCLGFFLVLMSVVSS